jgi:hypothetical protein
MVSKADLDLCAGDQMARRGIYFHAPMNTKIDELFATLRILISDQSRDLAMAMAELANVAKERDKALTERDEAGVRADFADLAAERRSAELEKLRIQHRDAVAGWNKAAIERDNARRSGESKSAAQGLTLATLCDLVLGEDAQDRSDDALVRAASKLAAERDKLKAERNSLAWSLSRAKESLRAAEQDAAEVESANSDLRTVNARLIAERDAAQDFNDILKGVNLRLTADLAAAMQRADTAEAILRAKA